MTMWFKGNTCTSMSSSMPFLSACSANFLMASASLSWAWDKGFAIKCKSTFSLALTDQQILLAWIWARSSCIRRQLSAYWRLHKSPWYWELFVVFCCLFVFCFVVFTWPARWWWWRRTCRPRYRWCRSACMRFSLDKRNAKIICR